MVCCGWAATLFSLELVCVMQSLFAQFVRGGWCRQAQLAADLCVDPLHLFHLLLELHASILLRLELLL